LLTLAAIAPIVVLPKLVMGWSKQLGPGVERGLNYTVNISSVAGLCPLHAPPYSSIKGGIYMMSHKMRVELAGTNVRMTEIFPTACTHRSSTPTGEIRSGRAPSPKAKNCSR